MLGRVILWSALWVTLLCEWFPMKNEAKFKKNITLGVTLPREAREDPQVADILRGFRQKTDRSCMALGILSAAGVLIPDLTPSILCWTVMLVLIMVLPVVVFALQNKKLRALKKEKGWTVPGKAQIRVDLSVIVDYPKPKLFGYLLCAVLCGIPMIFQRSLWWVHLLDLGIVAMSYGFAVLCYRKKSETVDADPERTRALSLLRYRKWKQIWLLCACCGVAASYSLWVMELSPMVGMGLLMTSTVLLCAAVIGLEMQTRKQQESLTRDSGTDWYADEDDYWLGGMFYCNPNDSHMMVNARTGVGTTVNLATVGGKLVTGITIVVVAGSLILLAAMALGDRSEIRLEAAEDQILCRSGGTYYEVPLEEIEEIRLAEELPEDLFRTMGVGGQYLIKGRFSSGEMPDLRVIADPTAGPYLIVRQTDGTCYLFGTRDPEQTARVYEALRSALAQRNPGGSVPENSPVN